MAHDVNSPCNPGWPNLLWKPPRPPQCPDDLLQQPHAGVWTPLRSNVQPHYNPTCTRVLFVSTGHICHDHTVCLQQLLLKQVWPCHNHLQSVVAHRLSALASKLGTSNVPLQNQQQLSTASPAKHSILHDNQPQWVLMHSHAVLHCSSRLVCSVLLSHACLQGRLSTVVHLLNSPG